MFRWICAFLLVSCIPAAAAPAACYNARLQAFNGIYLRVSSGLVYEVVPGRSRSLASFWLPEDRLKLCQARATLYDITDTTRRHPETIQAILVQ